MSSFSATLPRPYTAPIDSAAAALLLTWLVTSAFCFELCLRLADPYLMGWVIAGSAVLVGLHFRTPDSPRSTLIVATVAPMFSLVFGILFGEAMRLAPGATLDPAFARVDHGIAPAIWHWFQAHPVAFAPVHTAYLALPAAMLIAIGFARGENRTTLIRAQLIGAALVLPWYFILPAVGPAHVGQPFAPRNCMPSMHCTWALLIFTNATGRRAKWFAGIFAALTAVATLATGEHYTPDILAAIPWTWTLNRICGATK